MWTKRANVNSQVLGCQFLCYVHCMLLSLFIPTQTWMLSQKDEIWVEGVSAALKHTWMKEGRKKRTTEWARSCCRRERWKTHSSLSRGKEKSSQNGFREYVEKLSREKKKQFTFHFRIHPEYLLKIIYKIQQITNAERQTSSSAASSRWDIVITANSFLSPAPHIHPASQQEPYGRELVEAWILIISILFTRRRNQSE